jgi:oligopeptide/dipeptide ABC transporter ATP-binding protein
MSTGGIRVQDLLIEMRPQANRPGRRLVGPIDIDVAPGMTTGLIGESGSGKTLILRALANVLPAGVDARDRNGAFRSTRKTAMVFQDPMSFFNPRWRIERSIGEVLHVVRGMPRDRIPATTEELLSNVDLSVTDGRLFPFEMSGGMVQRAAIAMALAVEPEIFLADEVTSALDPTTRDRILRLICDAGRERHAATIVVSHDISSLIDVVDQVIVLYDGIAVETGAPEPVLRTGRHRYTDLLARSLPGDSTRGTTLPEIPREPDNGGSVASRTIRGCPFAGRCPEVRRRCTEELPPWDGSPEHRYRCFVPVESIGK